MPTCNVISGFMYKNGLCILTVLLKQQIEPIPLYIHNNYTYIYIHTYIRTYVCTYVHTYIHTYIHIVLLENGSMVHDSNKHGQKQRVRSDHAGDNCSMAS